MAKPKMMSVPRSQGHRFSEVPSAQIQRSQFDRSFGVKTTFDAGYLVPIFVDEVLPGDTFNVRMTGFARLATPLVPIMDNLYMETFFFAVPYRLVWDNWQKFNGEQKNPGDSTDYVIPRCADGDVVSEQSVADYMGIPLGLSTTAVKVSALPFRAYRLIWNEWFRDQNLQNSQDWLSTDGPDPLAYTGMNNAPLKRGKRHDYFTSCLPWPQKGDSVTIPLGGQADVWSAGAVGAQVSILESDGTRHLLDSDAAFVDISASGATSAAKLYADLSAATSASINALRQAFQIQRLLERDARGGTRYTEIIRSHFGVTSPDQRLQRPEYLGGGSSPVTVSPVAQTSSTDATTPQGNLAAIGTATLSGHGFVKSFTEHCVIIGLLSVRADLTYQQGLERMWSRQTRYDFYWPALAHIGEQAVLNKEIFVQNTAADDAVFGYQERYAEYRYKPNLVTGRFRSNAVAPLDIWHLAQDFSTLPALNTVFIQENPPIDRVVAVPTEPDFLFDGFFRIKAARPMPLYGVPGMIDHF